MSDSLAVVSSPVDVDDPVLYTLNGFLTEYNSIKTSIRTRTLAISIEELHVLLLVEELNINGTRSQLTDYIQHRPLSPPNLTVMAFLMMSLLVALMVAQTSTREARTRADNTSIEGAVALDLPLGVALLLRHPTTDLVVRSAIGPATLPSIAFIGWITATWVAILPFS